MEEHFVEILVDVFFDDDVVSVCFDEQDLGRALDELDVFQNGLKLLFGDVQLVPVLVVIDD